MARVRMIKPGFFLSEDIAELSPHARLLFIGLWSLADREGRLLDKPKTIKAQILPHDSVDVDALLSELGCAETYDKAPFIIRYEVQGMPLIQITRFAKHQNPHKREVESLLPPCTPSADAQAVEDKPVTAEAQPRPVQVPSKAVPSPAYTDTKTNTDPCPSNSDGVEVEIPDPLSDKPVLDAIHKRLRECILEEHPRAKIPEEGSDKWDKERKAVDQMVRLDKHTESDLKGMFKWLYTSDDAQAIFWKKQVQSIANLRTSKNGMSKLNRIHRDWKDGGSKTPESDKQRMAKKSDAELLSLGFSRQRIEGLRNGL